MSEKTNTGDSRYQCDGCSIDSGKRRTLKTVAGLALTIGAGTGIRPVSASEGGPKKGDWLVLAEDKDKEEKTPLRSADLTAGEKQKICLPFDPVNKKLKADRLDEILVIKLDPGSMAPATAKLAVDGVIAYSAVCTHQNCIVSAWFPDDNALTCFCHFTKFDATDGAAVLDGPAPRPLPAIPLMVDDEGRLVIAGDFTEPPGGSA